MVLTLCEMSCVMVPILVDTNPYSWEKRKYGEVSGSRHAAYTLSIRTRIFPESNYFRGMEYPISGHVIETRRYGLCYPNLYSKRSRHAKILFRRMRWNSTIREVSSVFTSPKFHGTWNTRDSNTTGIPRFMKLPMLKSWQNSLIRENCNTFIILNSTILSISMHDIEKSDTAFLLHWYLTICFLPSFYWISNQPGQHCTSLHFKDLFVGLQYYTENDF